MLSLQLLLQLTQQVPGGRQLRFLLIQVKQSIYKKINLIQLLQLANRMVTSLTLTGNSFDKSEKFIVNTCSVHFIECCQHWRRSSATDLRTLLLQDQ